MAKKKKFIQNKKNKSTKPQPSTDNTHIVCVLDSSGSMASTIDEARNGFNQYINKQKQLEGKATITAAMFDEYTNYEVVYDNLPINKARDITKDVWYPRGMTALYDAIGKTAMTVKRSHEKMSKKDRPNKVLFIIVTDGHENNSNEYKGDAGRMVIQNMIEDLEENNNWKFVYLGADPTEKASEIGSSFGISKGNTLQFTNTSAGTSGMYAVLNDATATYRGMASTTSADSLIVDANDGSNELDDE